MVMLLALSRRLNLFKWCFVLKSWRKFLAWICFISKSNCVTLIDIWSFQVFFMWISDGFQLVGGQGPREDDLVSYEKYQLVILGVLQTRVTYWYTYRLPNTYLPIWLGDLFVYFLLCPTKLQFLNRIRISWPINCAVQVPKNQKPHFANVYF